LPAKSGHTEFNASRCFVIKKSNALDPLIFDRVSLDMATVTSILIFRKTTVIAVI